MYAAFSQEMRGGPQRMRQKRLMRRHAKAMRVDAEEDEDMVEALAMDDGADNMAMADEPVMMEAAAMPAAMPVTQSAGLESGTTSTLFSIPHRATVPSDGTSRKVVVATEELEATLQYKTTPRSAPHAFLTMNATNKLYPLLPGPVQVFLDGDYTSTAHMQLVSPGEDFGLPLGVDDGIKVTTVPDQQRDAQKGLLMLETNRRTQTHEMTLHNTKAVPVEVKVVDRVPRSAHKDLKVALKGHTVQASAEGVIVKFSELERGNIEWLLSLPPGAKQTLTATVEIEWPKGKSIFPQRM